MQTDRSATISRGYARGPVLGRGGAFENARIHRDLLKLPQPTIRQSDPFGVRGYASDAMRSGRPVTPTLVAKMSRVGMVDYSRIGVGKLASDAVRPGRPAGYTDVTKRALDAMRSGQPTD